VPAAGAGAGRDLPKGGRYELAKARES